MRKRLVLIFVSVFVLCLFAGGVAVASAYTEERYNQAFVSEIGNDFNGSYFRWLYFDVTHEGYLNYGDTIVQVQQGYSETRKMALTRDVCAVTALEVYSSAFIRNGAGTETAFDEKSVSVSDGYTYSCKAQAELPRACVTVSRTSHTAYLRIDGVHYDNYVIISYD